MRIRWAMAGCIVLLFSCHVNTSSVDAGIDAEIRHQMDSLNKAVIGGVTGKDPARIKSICSDSLWAQAGNAISTQILHNQKALDSGKFRIRNQFYLANYGSTLPATMHRLKGNDHDYILTFMPLNAETAVTLGYFADTIESFSLTTAYGKYNDTWKLNILQIGLLKIMNGDAIDWYHKAQRDYNNGYLVDAGNDLLLCEELLKPAGDFVHYIKEKEINETDQRLTAAITQRYPFPLKDSLVSTKPEIFKISLNRTAEGYFPIVLYNTRLSLSDSGKVAKENNDVCAHLGELFKGLDQGKRFMYFRVYGRLAGDTSGKAYLEFKKESKKGNGLL